MRKDGVLPFAAGDVIDDRYILGDPLGIGGMGIVFAAIQPALARTVAIKLLRPELRANGVALRRFQDEAIAGARLAHPNIVSVFDFGQAQSGPFLAMQRLHGRSLGQLATDGGRFSIARAASILQQILSALVEAHRLGIIHSDVKSDNVLVETDDDGREHATLIDFGLVRLPDRPFVDDNHVSGTPDYIAPEIVSGHAPTARSDIYSAGCVLYELVTGQTPFGKGSVHEIMENQLHGRVVPPSAMIRGFPPDFETVILRALAKHPVERFASAAEFAIALAAATPALPSTGTTLEMPAMSSSAVTLDFHEEPEPLACARAAVGHAIASGDVDRIVVAYLDLAYTLVGRHELAAAINELAEAADVITAGDYVTAKAGSPLWRLVLSMAAIQEGLGDHAQARRLALDALCHAVRAKSHVGRIRAKRLIRYLERYRSPAREAS